MASDPFASARKLAASRPAPVPARTLTPEEKRAANTAKIVKHLLSSDRCPRLLTYDCYFEEHIDGEDASIAQLVRDEFRACGFVFNGHRVRLETGGEFVHGGHCPHIKDPGLNMQAHMRAFRTWADKRSAKFIKAAVKTIGRQQEAACRMECEDADQFLTEHINTGLKDQPFDFQQRACVICFHFEQVEYNSIDGGTQRYYLVARPERAR